MKLTKSKLKKIILEEMRRVLKEQEAPALTANQMRKMANALCFKQGRVWFAGPRSTMAQSNANMAKARRNPQWRCPANDKLGFKDWSDARKLADADDAAAFQQFIQSKKGGAPAQQDQPRRAAQPTQPPAEKPPSEVPRRSNRRGLDQKVAPKQPELKYNENEIERTFDCRGAENSKLGTKWKRLINFTRARQSAGYWNPLAPVTAGMSHKELHDISKELLAVSPWLKTNKIKLAKGCELPIAKLYKALERQLKQLHSKKRSTPPHTIKYRTEGEYIIATATTKDKKHSAKGKARIRFDNEDQAKANAQERATKKLIRKTHEEQ